MSVTVIQRKPNHGHSKPLPRIDLNLPARLRVGHLMSYYGLSHSAVYVHLDKGLIPPADGKIGGRKYWRTETIKNHLEKSDLKAGNSPGAE